jgi:lysozyme
MDRCPAPVSVDRFHDELAIFLAAVERHYGKPATLYLTREFDDAYRVSARVHRPLWLASLAAEPDFGARPFTLWQVSHTRRLDGIDGHVDWNVARP